MFTSREYDGESGNYYFRTRVYNPKIGRFLQRDPIGYVDGMNLYEYVGGNSINILDPYGLWWNWKGARTGAVNVVKGAAVGAVVVGGILLLPATASGAALTTLGIAGAAYLGLTTGQVITGRNLNGAVICDEERSAMAVEAMAGIAALGSGVAAAKIKPNVTDSLINRTPKSLMDQMVLEAAQQGKGKMIIESLNDPRFKGMEKWSYGEKSSQGYHSEVHYVRDPKTGQLTDFKFKFRADTYK